MWSESTRPVDPNRAWMYAKDYIQKTKNLKSTIETKVWSPIVWKGGYRKEENFVSSQYCVLDFDSGTTIEEAVQNKFADCNYIIGITKSHRKEKHGVIADRFRVIIPFERAITCVHEFKHNMEKYISFYGSDERCVDAARYYFPCAAVTHIQILDPDENLPIHKLDKKIEKKEYNHYGSKLPNWIIEILTSEHPHLLDKTESRNMVLFRLSAGLAGCGIANESLIFQYVQKSNLMNPCMTKDGRKKERMSDGEAKRTIRSGVKAGFGEFQSSRR